MDHARRVFDDGHCEETIPVLKWAPCDVSMGVARDTTVTSQCTCYQGETIRSPDPIGQRPAVDK